MVDGSFDYYAAAIAIAAFTAISLAGIGVVPVVITGGVLGLCHWFL